VATTRPERLHFTGDAAADELIARDPLALLIGFELDQQVPVQWAFSAPLELKRRLGDNLDAREIAGMDPAKLEEAFVRKPALHRYPAVMARRTQDLCAAIASEYGGDPERIWSEAESGEELRRRLLDLPGIGDMKVRSLLAILVKRFGVRPPGWEDVLPTHPTLGDVDSPETFERYAEAKRAYKAKRKAESR
jgi:uncharacterized HhH-GPD family protein